MADNNVLYVKIIAEIDELSKGLKEAEDRLDGFGKEGGKAVEGVKNAADDAGTALKGVGKSATVAGASMRSAMIATGIGALVVALGLVIDHWDDIKEAVFGVDSAIQEYLTTMEGLTRANTLLDQQKTKLEALEKLYISLGWDADSLKDKEGQALQGILDNLIVQRGKMEDEAERLKKVWLETGGDIAAKKLKDLDLAYGEIQIAITEARTAVTDFNNELGTLPETIITIEKPLEAITQKALDFSDAFKIGTRDVYGAQLAFRALSEELENNAPEWSKITEGTDKVLEDVEQFNESFDTLIRGQLSRSLTDLGTMLGEALAGAGDVTQTMGQRLLGFFGGIMKQFGAMLISLGVGVIAFDTALTSGNGYAAIAAGVALVALGAFVSSKMAEGINMGNSSTGGGGSSYAGAPTSAGSSQTNYTGGFGNGGVYSMEVEGTKLVAVLNNTTNRNRALGSNLGIG